MSMIPCDKGHFYNDAEHGSCPYCGVPLNDATPLPPIPPTRSDHPPGPSGETIHLWTGRSDPVVGWLVCVEGPDRGRDYRIHAERNFIGRDPTMDIAITGDRAISREKHAVISYNPRNRTFRIAPGEQRGIVYLNDEEVLSPMPLAPYDWIELGATRLLFVPFCGERFTWPVEAAERSASKA